MDTANNNCIRSAPRQAVPRKPQKPQKLKASCDFCAMSKVKCDRGQPQCLRCIRNEVACHYSESRRIGKARRIFGATGPGSKQSNFPTQEAWGQQAVQEGCTRTHDSSESPDYSISVDEFDEDAMMFIHEADLTANISAMPSHLDLVKHRERSDNRQSTSLDDMNFLTSQFPDFMQEICEGQAPQTMEIGGNTQNNSNSQLHLSSSFSTGEPRVCNSVGTTYKAKTDCMELACMTIKSLHMPAEPCALSNDDAKNADIFRSIDSTLKTSRSARETVGQILACPCACSWNLLYLLVLITRQLIGTYSALLEQQLSTPTPSLSSSSSAQESTASSAETRSTVFDITMTIGGYVLDGESKMKVIAQVIRSQIDDTAELIDSLASRSAEIEKTVEEPAALCWAGLIESLQLCRERALHSCA
ncbi:hypothetical protein BKA59DRAFT_451975 [Fusarium tricinctum]|uniref:Zn(2)-C6 fungal-type domain-containing protein n=1 Tax=Fusarium tricinctum TaxID=61284 RepID=A0A8K0S2W7_9HYPO|nr:hypothetical protein BKA59DRAFT_451975 [Fusarium tricinctum]